MPRIAQLGRWSRWSSRGVVEGEPTSSGIGAEQLLAELLSRRQLGAEECEERDAELAETIYSQ